MLWFPVVKERRKVYVQNCIKWSTNLTELKMFNKCTVKVWRECGCPISSLCIKNMFVAREKLQRRQNIIVSMLLLINFFDAWCIKDSKQFSSPWKTSTAKSVSYSTVLKRESFVNVFRNSFIDSANKKAAVSWFAS